MLKRTINYEDFNGENVSEVVYFNLTKSELIELEVSYNNGFSDSLQSIIEAKDQKSLISEFKKIVLLSYGIKSEDGKRFIKSDKLREEFEQTAAYNSLFMELAINDGAAAAFINGIMPKDLIVADQDKPDANAAPHPASVAQLPPPINS